MWLKLNSNFQKTKQAMTLVFAMEHLTYIGNNHCSQFDVRCQLYSFLPPRNLLWQSLALRQYTKEVGVVMGVVINGCGSTCAEYVLMGGQLLAPQTRAK